MVEVKRSSLKDLFQVLLNSAVLNGGGALMRVMKRVNGRTLAEAAGEDYFGRGRKAWLKLIKEAIMWQILNRSSKV